MSGIKGFIETSLLDWPGRIASVLFLGGCNFRCPICHNRDLAVAPHKLPNFPKKEIIARLVRKRKWLDGVTITGGEPTIYPGLIALIEDVRRLGLRVKLDTNGYNPAVLSDLLARKLVDAVYMDVKAPLTSRAYAVAAGKRVNIEKIRESIEILKASAAEVVFRTVAIPGRVEEPELALIRESLGEFHAYMVQSFRNACVLDAVCEELPEFGLERLERMRAEFEVSPATLRCGACLS
jgi:pyruvate formate lyase activating enzyme